MNFKHKILTFTIATIFTTSYVFAAVPHSFSAGTAAKASEVNENFNAVDTVATEALEKATAVEENLTTVSSDVTDLTSSLSTLSTTSATKAELTTLETQVNALPSAETVTLISSDVTNLSTDLTNLESSLNTLSTSAANKDELIVLETIIGNLSDDITVAGQENSIEMDINCDDDSQALINAYAANATAASLRFNLTGACEGDFQGIEMSDVLIDFIFPTPDLLLIDETGTASIIPNATTGLVNLRASSSTLVIAGVDVEAGALESYPIFIADNANAYIQDATISGGGAAATLVYVVRSSNLQADNINLNTADVGVRIYNGSQGIIQNYTSVNVDYGLRVSTSTLLLKGTQEHGDSRVYVANNAILTLGSDTVLTAGRTDVYFSQFIQGSTAIVTINDRLTIAEGSTFKGRHLTLGEDIYVQRNSSLRCDGPFLMTDASGRLNVDEGSSANLSEGNISDLSVREKGFVYLEGDSDGEFITITGETYIEQSDLKADYTTFAALEVSMGSTVYLQEGNTIDLNNLAADDSSHIFFGDIDPEL